MTSVVLLMDFSFDSVWWNVSTKRKMCINYSTNIFQEMLGNHAWLEELFKLQGKLENKKNPKNYWYGFRLLSYYLLLICSHPLNWVLLQYIKEYPKSYEKAITILLLFLIKYVYDAGFSSNISTKRTYLSRLSEILMKIQVSSIKLVSQTLKRFVKCKGMPFLPLLFGKFYFS